MVVYLVVVFGGVDVISVVDLPRSLVVYSAILV